MGGEDHAYYSSLLSRKKKASTERDAEAVPRVIWREQIERKGLQWCDMLL